MKNWRFLVKAKVLWLTANCWFRTFVFRSLNIKSQQCILAENTTIQTFKKKNLPSFLVIQRRSLCLQSRVLLETRKLTFQSVTENIPNNGRRAERGTFSDGRAVDVVADYPNNQKPKTVWTVIQTVWPQAAMKTQTNRELFRENRLLFVPPKKWNTKNFSGQNKITSLFLGENSGFSSEAVRPVWKQAASKSHEALATCFITHGHISVSICLLFWWFMNIISVFFALRWPQKRHFFFSKTAGFF